MSTKTEVIELPVAGHVPGFPYPDFPESLKTFNERRAYQLGVAHGCAIERHKSSVKNQEIVAVLLSMGEGGELFACLPDEISMAAGKDLDLVRALINSLIDVDACTTAAPKLKM